MKNLEFLRNHGVDIDKSLELFGDIKTYNETINEFIGGLTSKRKKLMDYLNTKDMPNYAIYAHSLKSDARYFGFTKLAEIAYQHELNSKSGDLYYVESDYTNLDAAVTEALNIIKDYMSNTETTLYEKTTPQPKPSQSSVIPKEKEQSTVPAYTKQTILVVDDSNIIRNFVKRIFEEDYDIGIAKDGKEAIDIIEANKNNENIFAILLDLNMPVVDGFKVLEYMQENDLFRQMPVSIISGDSAKETIDKAFKYPIVDMLGKPFNNSDVKRVIDKTILYKDLI